MVLAHLSQNEQQDLLALLDSGQLGPVYVASHQEDVLAALGEPDFINIQCFGSADDETLARLTGGRSQNIRVDTFPDAEHDLLLEHYTYGRLQVTLKDRLVSHFIVTYADHQSLADSTHWLEFLSGMTHDDLKTLFVELQIDQHIYYHEGYEDEGPMLVRPDRDFDIDFVVGADGPLHKIMVSGHRARGIPTIQINLVG